MTNEMTRASALEEDIAARQIGLTFGAEITGMPIHGDVSPERLTQFIAFPHRYRVLIVPDVDLDPAGLVAFSRRFGPLEIHSRFENTLPAERHVFCVGNGEPDGMKASFWLSPALSRRKSQNLRSDHDGQERGFRFIPPGSIDMTRQPRCPDRLLRPRSLAGARATNAPVIPGSPPPDGGR